MPASIIPTFLIYAYIGAITPGPANLCSLASALRYGKKAALQQWKGIFFGFFVVSMCSVVVTYLIGTALNEYVSYLSWIGAAYILWMAWHMLRSSGIETDENPDKPTFKRGLFVQLTNVKIMVYCLTALSSYVLPYTDSFWWLFGVGLFMPFTGPIGNLIWLFAGASLQKLFSKYSRIVNVILALSLSACAVSLLWPH